MAWIEETKNGCFRVGWRDPSGRQRYRSASSEVEAQALRLELETNGGVPPQQPQTLGRYIETMLDTSWDLRASTIYAYRHVYARHVASRLGRRPMPALTTGELRSFFSALTCGPSARASVYRLLAKTLNLSVREGVLDRSPLKAIPRPKAERSEIRPLSIEQVEALADAIEPRYRLAVLLGAYLGMRAGEIGGLRLEDLDLERATLRVMRATRRDGGKRVLGDVKTPAGRRRISIPAFLADEIRRHVDTYPPSADERLITTPTGGLVVSTILLRAFVEAASRLGLRRPRFHDLRHSAASLMIAEGAHPKVIQTRLGHSTIQVTLDIYGHLFPSLDATVAAQLDTARTRAISAVTT